MTKSAFAMVALLGCGGGSSHGPVALTDLGAAIGASYCQKEFSCCTDAEVMMDFGSFTVGGQPITTEAQCETFYSGFVGSLINSQYMTSIAAGRITYDGNAAGSCIDVLDGLSCSAFGSETGIDSNSDCKGFIVPKVATGAACAQNYECVSNNCVGATTSPAKDGTCMALPQSGEACTFDCAAGLFCDFAMGDKCEPLQANGASCGSNEDSCASGFCDGATTSQNGVCAGKPARCDGR